MIHPQHEPEVAPRVGQPRRVPVRLSAATIQAIGVHLARPTGDPAVILRGLCASPMMPGLILTRMNARTALTAADLAGVMWRQALNPTLDPERKN